MGNDVVQLPRDPGPLLLGGTADRLGALPLQSDHVSLLGVGPGLKGAQPPRSDGDRREDQERDDALRDGVDRPTEGRLG